MSFKRFIYAMDWSRAYLEKYWCMYYAMLSVRVFVLRVLCNGRRPDVLFFLLLFVALPSSFLPILSLSLLLPLPPSHFSFSSFPLLSSLTSTSPSSPPPLPLPLLPGPFPFPHPMSLPSYSLYPPLSLFSLLPLKRYLEFIFLIITAWEKEEKNSIRYIFIGKW